MVTAADRLEALGKAATPGVYEADLAPDYNGPQRGAAVIATDPDGAATMVAVCWRPESAALIVALVNALPELVAVLRAAEATVGLTDPPGTVHITAGLSLGELRAALAALEKAGPR